MEYKIEIRCDATVIYLFQINTKLFNQLKSQPSVAKNPFKLSTEFYKLKWNYEQDYSIATPYWCTGNFNMTVYDEDENVVYETDDITSIQRHHRQNKYLNGKFIVNQHSTNDESFEGYIETDEFDPSKLVLEDTLWDDDGIFHTDKELCITNLMYDGESLYMDPMYESREDDVKYFLIESDKEGARIVEEQNPVIIKKRSMLIDPKRVEEESKDCSNHDLYESECIRESEDCVDKCKDNPKLIKKSKNKEIASEWWMTNSDKECVVPENSKIVVSEDREKWVSGSSDEQMGIVDKLLAVINGFTVDGEYELRYSSSYIGLQRGGKVLNWSYFIPQRKKTIVYIKVVVNKEWQDLLDKYFSGSYEVMKGKDGYKLALTNDENLDKLEIILREAEQERLKK